MAELNESQLLLLDNLIYLQDVVDKNKQTVGEVVDKLLHGGGLESSRNMSKIGTEDEYPCKMSKDEWLVILRAIDKDSQLKSLTITNGQTGVMYDKKGEPIKGSDGKVLESGMRVATFVDPEDQAIVVYRGTGGDLEWHDNGQGGYLTDTEQQMAALKYIENLEYTDITVTGHSKGGNKTQYVAILSDKVDRAVSFDGQGFSKEFLEKYKDQIAANAHKITSISAEDDFVNCLLNPIASVIKYIDTDKQAKFTYNHRPNIVLNEKGQLRDKASQGEISKLINGYTVYINKTMKEPFRSYTIDGLLALMESGEEGFKKEGMFQTGVSAVMALSHLDDYTFSNFSEKYGDQAELAVTLLASTLMPYAFGDDFIQSLGTNLGQLAQLIGEKLRQFGDWIVKKFEQAVAKIKDVAGNIGEAVAKYAEKIREGWNQLLSGIQDAADAIKNATVSAGEAVSRFVNRSAQAVKSLCNNIAEGTKQAIDAVQNTWNKSVDKVTDTFRKVGEGAKAKAKDFTKGVSEMVHAAKQSIGHAGKKASGTVKDFVGKVAAGIAVSAQGAMQVDVSRFGDIKSKVRHLDSTIESRATQMAKEAKRIASGVASAYSESNVQNQLRRLEKSYNDVLDRSRRVSEELQRKIDSLARAQEQYIQIEQMLSSRIRGGLR